MLTNDDIKKIKELKAMGYRPREVAAKLKLSMLTVLCYWKGGKKLSVEDLFSIVKCPYCGTVFPAPKFQRRVECAYCRKELTGNKRWFKPETPD